MSDSFKITGNVHQVLDLEQPTEKMTVRRFSIVTDEQYPQTIQFQAVNDRCDAVGTIYPGEKITVSFDIRGREWNGKVITNLNVWRIEKHGVTQSALPPASGFAEPVKAPSIDDLPF